MPDRPTTPATSPEPTPAEQHQEERGLYHPRSVAYLCIIVFMIAFASLLMAGRANRTGAKALIEARNANTRITLMYKALSKELEELKKNK